MRSACCFRLLPLFGLALSVSMAGAPAQASDYRYSIQLDDPTKVIRTDRETGATLVCRNLGHLVWCPPTAEACQTIRDTVQAWQAEQGLPSQQQVIDCLQHNQCDPKPPQRPPAAIPGVDDRTVTYCLEPQNDQRPD